MFGFFYPLPHSHVHKSADFVSFICFLGTPPSTHCRRHIWKPPKGNTLFLLKCCTILKICISPFTDKFVHASHSPKIKSFAMQIHFWYRVAQKQNLRRARREPKRVVCRKWLCTQILQQESFLDLQSAALHCVLHVLGKFQNFRASERMRKGGRGARGKVLFKFDLRAANQRCPLQLRDSKHIFFAIPSHFPLSLYESSLPNQRCRHSYASLTLVSRTVSLEPSCRFVAA